MRALIKKAMILSVVLGIVCGYAMWSFDSETKARASVNAVEVVTLAEASGN